MSIAPVVMLTTNRYKDTGIGLGKYSDMCLGIIYYFNNIRLYTGIYLLSTLLHGMHIL